MRRFRIVPFLVAIPLLGMALFPTACQDRPADDSEVAAVTPRRVNTAVVGGADTASTLRFAGTVRSARRARVSFTVPGRLADRPVVAGDQVVAGQRLARLESLDLGNALAVAEAALGEARARAEQAALERRRVETLVAEKAATAEEFERALAGADASASAVARAEAQVAEARRRSGEAVLTAPWAGTVTEVMAQPGEYLGSGDPVLELAGEGRPEVEIRVPEAFLQTLPPGSEVEVALPFASRGDAGRIAGTVLAAGAAAGGPGRLFPVLVGLAPDAAVASGRAVEVLVERRAAEGLSLPLTAVLNPGGSRPVVFRVDRAENDDQGEAGAGVGAGGEAASRAVEVPVRVESLAGDRVVVTADGLQPGDQVVVSGHLGLIDGDPVRPAPASENGGTQ